MVDEGIDGKRMFIAGALEIFNWQTELGRYGWHLVVSHGYIAIFALLFLSGVGLPLPEDVPLIAAGVCVSRGGMTWALAGPVAWVAMMLGDSALYLIGYVFGFRVVHLPVIGRHISPALLKKCEGWFARWGVWAVGIGRMFAGIRTAIVVTAGTMRFPYGKLLAADGLAAIISGGAFMGLGFFAGRHAGESRDLIDKYRIYISLTALVAALLLMLVLWMRSRRRAAEAAEAAVAGAAAAAKFGDGIAPTIKPM
jgi:membrane protein DedA with SNARE-associated domain